MYLTIRSASIEDAKVLLELIRELAIFEKEPDAVETTIEELERDGFSAEPLFNAFIVESNAQVIGMAITYFRYSTWKGKTLYLEDLYVKEKYRGLGAGKLLFEHCIAFAQEQKCNRMSWQVLDWNTDAINFYKQYGTYIETEWYNCSLQIGV